jgi:hypothetical protein
MFSFLADRDIGSIARHDIAFSAPGADHAC